MHLDFELQGKFNPDPGKGLEISCRLCEQGRYCSKVGLSASEGDCDAGYYCIKGSPSRTPVSPGC